MIFNDKYICIRTLVIMSDNQYGYHVYAKHGYKDIEVSFNTDTDNLLYILEEINIIFKKYLEEKRKN